MMTSAGRNYPNAPIAEAVCDIRVQPRGELGPDALTPIVEQLRGDYPHADEQFEIQAQMVSTVPVPVGTIPSVSQKKIGIRARSADGTRIYQAQVLGLAVSKLKPYTNWLDFKKEARKIWNCYREVTKPSTVTRIALRYINRIDIPGRKPIQLEDFFETYVQISKELVQPLSNFFFQVHIPLPEIDAMCVLNGAGLPPAAPNVGSVMIDIDVFKITAIPKSDDEMWDVFDLLREKKNLIFESSITDRTRSLFR